MLDDLRAQGYYTRPTEVRDGLLYDTISEHSMATEFAISRFLTPLVARTGLALFTDCDVLYRRKVSEIFRQAKSKYAVMCVKHNHVPTSATKMDGQVQSKYNRKNWSSVMLFDCDHPSNRKLTPKLINSVPGRDLHAFCWLDDDEIGELNVEWNWLVGHSDESVDPAIVHFTDGYPLLPGYESVKYADEWNAEYRRWAARF